MLLAGGEVSKKMALLEGPPPGYDFRASTSAATRAVVAQDYPQLLALVDRGEPVLRTCPVCLDLEGGCCSQTLWRVDV